MQAEDSARAAATRSRAELAADLGRSTWHQAWYARLATFVATVAVVWLAVAVCDVILTDFDAALPWGGLAFAVVLAVLSTLLRPVLVAGAVRLGWFGVLLLAVVGQALVVALTARLIPEVRVDSFVAALLVSVVIGVVATVIGWFTTAGTSEALVGRLVASGRRRRAALGDPEVGGVVFVQLDGVPFPVLQMAVNGGTLPTLSRWIRSGSHVLHEWVPALPATTPASQMGILHGVIDGIPAFRWYDRDDDKVLVANRPADAAVIETRLSNGRGLLVDGGVSISNLFTGDAPTAALTMSRQQRAGEDARRAVAEFVMHPNGLTRSLLRSFSELSRDRFQARRAVRRDLQPRCHRTWTTALLRCVTNGVLRDLNTVLVAQHMLAGARSIYVDYVDYDEIAHHAGMLRPESLDALERVDGVLRQLELVASVAPRRYQFVVLSDHGQAQGTTFADRYGEELAALVARLARADVAASDEDVEGWGRTQALVDELATGKGVTGKGLQKTSAAMQRNDRNEPVEVGHREGQGVAPGTETFHVFGSGNLGLVYVRGERSRLTLEQVEQRYAGLVAGLAAHPGVGFVAVIDDAGDVCVFGNHGSVNLGTGVVDGIDPLIPFGERAHGFVRRAGLRPEAPDIYVNSLVEPGTEDVAAFEGLVGCHGGLGGWQDRAFVVVPNALPYPTETVVGADAMHVALRTMLRDLGQRAQVPDEEPRPVPVDRSGPTATRAIPT
ncbi:MAG TPA: phage holin family protein [Nocardioides sp.]|uniref:phage holin family protein n=1 Tax=Nocardioides sp. TaxID=35761 RepID=UPI002D7FCB35|nr:phage holin family protein [Nocardioides sp.]HET6651749.1 phage holin family protein [Nocardioides sp.]